jgi:fructose-specific PTS system IIA-like component
MLCNERSGGEANVKSVLALIGADIGYGDPLCLRVEGTDREAAFEALREFVDEEFAATDGALPEVVSEAGNRALPPSLCACRPGPVLGGTAVCGGIAEGAVVAVAGLDLAPGIAEAAHDSSAKEYARFKRALATVQARLEDTIAGARDAEAEVLKAHLSLLLDASLGQTVARFLESGSANVGRAILAAACSNRAAFICARDPLIYRTLARTCSRKSTGRRQCNAPPRSPPRPSCWPRV